MSTKPGNCPQHTDKRKLHEVKRHGDEVEKKHGKSKTRKN